MMGMDSKDAFFQRFPKGCPSCGGLKRFITFTELEKPILAFNPLWALASSKGKKGYFAECQACHEAWVWQDELETWINTREVRKGTKRKVVTETDRRDKDLDIGKVY